MKKHIIFISLTLVCAFTSNAQILIFDVPIVFDEPHKVFQSRDQIHLNLGFEVETDSGQSATFIIVGDGFDLVPDDDEFAVLQSLYLTTGGDRWLHRDGWPTQDELSGKYTTDNSQFAG